MEKIFKTLDEQINILQSKGLTIPDEGYAKEILLRENYFFLSGYRHFLIKMVVIFFLVQPLMNYIRYFILIGI